VSRRFLVAAMAAGLAFVSTVARATPVTLGRTETNTDHVSFGLGGLGAGPGTFVVTGVDGPVRKAFLYWHGIDQGTGAVYDNETIQFAGASVTGVSLGDAETNCWEDGSSRAFFADVSHLVTGNGDYEISGLNSGGPAHEGNGASLIVLFNDASNANDRDLVFFEGNDSDVIETGVPPGDAAGWAATLPNINYTGGSVFAEMHVADGQSFPDASVTFSGASSVVIPDTSNLWDGFSVPDEGSGRFGERLWDIHRFDITQAFGSPGSQSVSLSGMNGTSDCHSLVVLMLELRAGSAPCGNGVLDEGEECDPGGAGTQTCGGLKSCINDCTCGCTSDFQCNDGNGCTEDECDVEGGQCLNQSDCPTGPGCDDTCDELNESCRLCGRPYRNDLCLVNAVFVLQAALELRDCQICLCDVNSTETVTASDALLILKDCAGVAVDLQCTFPD
jgi:hypothetical protein